MRKTLVLLLVLLLLIPQAYAAGDSTPLRFGSDEAVCSIYASYEIEEDVTEVTVTFADHVKNYAYSNFVNGKLWISIASVDSIDLNKPVGCVTAKNAGGQEIAPTLELASLNFNGEAAKGNLVLNSVQASLSGKSLSVNVDADDHFLGSYTLVVAAYDANGKMLDNGIKSVAFGEKQETFVANLTDCAEADHVKAFFLSSEWRPVATAEDREISK